MTRQPVKPLNGGSGACTSVVRNERGELFVRKTARFPQSTKLAAQHDWLRGHQHLKWVPRVRLFGQGDESLFLDLTYYEDFEPFYDFIHRSPVETSRQMLGRILNTLETDLYRNARPVYSPERLECYLHTKVLAKWTECTRRSSRISRLAETRELVVNEKVFLNLPWILDRIRRNPILMERLSTFDECTVHGDLTIENILVSGDDFKIVDPNNENWICDPMVDYAKLYQSLHSHYEQLTRISDVSVSRNHIRFEVPVSRPYEALFEYLKIRLGQSYSVQQRQALLFHEAMHFFRLLPYRLDRNELTFPLFYATAVRLFNEFYDQGAP